MKSYNQNLNFSNISSAIFGTTHWTLPKNKNILLPDTHTTCANISGGKKYLFFRTFALSTKRMIFFIATYLWCIARFGTICTI